jgi:hypothetical protein
MPRIGGEAVVSRGPDRGHCVLRHRGCDGGHAAERAHIHPAGCNMTPTSAGIVILSGILFIGLSVRSIKRFFRGQLSPDGVIVKLGEFRQSAVLGQVHGKGWDGNHRPMHTFLHARVEESGAGRQGRASAHAWRRRHACTPGGPVGEEGGIPQAGMRR